MVTEDTTPSYLGGMSPDYRVNFGSLPGILAPRYAGDNLTGLPGGSGAPRTVWGVPRYTADWAEGIVGKAQMADGQRSIISLQNRLAKAGFLTSVDPGNRAQTVAALKNAMTEANWAGATWQDVLKARMANAAGSGLDGSSSSGGGGGGGGSSYSSTSISNSSMVSRSVNLTGRGTAEGILRNALTQQLGREPTNQEVTAFKRALNVQERRHPTVTKSSSSTTTTTRGSTKGSHSSSTTNTSGSSDSSTKQSDVDPQEEARDFATSSKSLRQERRMYQNSQYLDVIEGMLGMN